MKLAIATGLCLLVVSCDSDPKELEPTQPTSTPPVEDSQAAKDIPVAQLIDQVVIYNVWFRNGETLNEAITILSTNLDDYCVKKNIIPVVVEPSKSNAAMSFGSSGMTARMLMKKMASEARLEFEIDEEERVIRFGKTIDQ